MEPPRGHMEKGMQKAEAGQRDYGTTDYRA